MFRICLLACVGIMFVPAELRLFARQDSKPVTVQTSRSENEAFEVGGNPGENSEPGEGPENASLRERVETLEKKLALMEQLLFKTVRLEQLEATERLKQAQAALENSRKLQLRGIITPAEVQLDLYQLEMARLQLQLTAAECDYREVSTHIDLVAARSELLKAQQRLRRYELQFPRGIISADALNRQKQVVEDRQRAVDFQEERLEAVQRLMGGTDETREPPTASPDVSGIEPAGEADTSPPDPGNGKADEDQAKSS